MKKIHRFIGQFDLSADRLLIRDPALIHQIRTVLKLRVGEKIMISDGRGQEALARINATAASGVEIEVEARRDAPEPKRDVVLYCAVLKRENFEFVVEKAVECGVKKIVPVHSARTVKLGIKLERLEKIVREAAEQCGRGIVPELCAPLRFKAALKSAAELDVNYFFDADGEEFLRPKLLSAAIGLWIGPEGGWEESEIEEAKQANMVVSSLGRLVLRAETAATVAVYLASR